MDVMWTITPEPCAIIEGSKGAVETNRREQVLVQGLVPFVVVEHDEAAGGRRGAPHDMHDDVDPPETLADSLGDHGTALGGRDVCGDELIRMFGQFGL